ncbi:hypothetical protein PVAND_016435 [Polypedilum vanderplanki]|uniref:RNase NYN domain-containing protein n=1 Tax=Polypedilum vanderplanki TaxID=319348 RepID=A0A9J6BFU0_POLVA|nr:hypothetical protein PVAND_016435 [Polypedilum vanderplanki]
MGFGQSKEKRIIFIDGSNVAFGFTNAKIGKIDSKDEKNFSAEGLKIAIFHFRKLGHEVKAIIPEFRMYKASNKQIMKDLKDSGFLMLIASKAYDDKVLLEAALKNNAAIVSNHRFRDVSAETQRYNAVIQKRQIRYNWACDKFILTQDPYGRNGPSLNEILYK